MATTLVNWVLLAALVVVLIVVLSLMMLLVTPQWRQRSPSSAQRVVRKSKDGTKPRP